jgi:hypothetical protein
MPGSTWFTLYADKQTHLISRTEYQGFDAEQGIQASIANDFLDYRPLLGSQEPFKIIEYTNGEKTTEATQDSTDVDRTIDDSYFAMPEEQRIARLEAGPVELPFEYAYNQILVKSRLNGGEEVSFILDSGASQSLLDEKVAKTMGPLHDANYNVTTGGGTMPMNYMIAKTMQLGDLVLNDLAFGVTNGSAFAQMHGSRPAGLLGANVLKRFLLTIDYPERKIILSDPKEVKIPPHAAVIATQPALGNLGNIVQGKLDGTLNLPLLVDTGAAFNNISSDLVKPLVPEPLLPVSKILGLDGEQIDVAAVRFKSITLGDLVVEKPVFSVAARPKGSHGGGIITSPKMAILGNPLFSKYRLTIDYRHNRLFLERSEQQSAFDATDDQLSRIRMQLRQDKNYQKARAACQHLLESPEARKFPAVSALIDAEEGVTTVDQARATSDRDLMLSAKKDFFAAESLADQCKNPTVKARIYAKLARHISDVDSSLVATSKKLVSQAIALAPMDAEVLTSAAMVLKLAESPAVAQRVVDQALSADPANWDALWLRYKLSSELGKPDEQKLVAAQLRRYYPNAPEVQALKN